MVSKKFVQLQKVLTTFVLSLLFLQAIVPATVVFADDGSGLAVTEERVTEEGIGIENSEILEEIELKASESEVEESHSEDIAKSETQTSDVEIPVNSEEKISEEDVAISAESSSEEVKEANNGIKAFSANEVRVSTEFDHIFTIESIKIGNEEIRDGDIIEIEEGTIASMFVTWDTEGLDVHEGDTATLKLASAFNVVERSKPENIVVQGDNGDTVVGTYTIQNGEVVFVFNKNIEQGNVHSGTLILSFEFNLEAFQENIRQEIPFYETTENNFTIIAKPIKDPEEITKTGEPNSKLNATDITWTVDVVNITAETLTGAQLSDDLPEGVGDPYDIQITPLTVNYNGDKVVAGDPISYDGGFPINFDSIEPYQGYRVTYKTDILDSTLNSFENKATFEYGDNKITKPAIVDGLERSESIEKKGEKVQNSTDDRVRWTIDVNKDGQEIANAIVEDLLEDYLLLDPDSIKIYKIEQNGNNWEQVGEALDEFKDVNEFPIELGHLSENEAYRIIFDTTVDWSKVNGGDYTEDNPLVNTTVLYDGEKKLDDDNDEIQFARLPIVEKSGNSNVNYNDKTIDWTITLNEAKHLLGDITATDILPEGLELVEGSIEIKGDEDGDFSNVKIVTPSGENRELKFEFTEVGTEKITITYKTKITDFTKTDFKNGVGIVGNGEGSGIGEGTNDDYKKDDETVKPAENVYTKNFVSINYDNNTISWKITVNPLKEAIKEGFTITDEYDFDGLILLEDSFKVTVGGEEYTTYELSPRNGNYNQGFELKFLSEIKGAEVVIEFTTSYSEDAGALPHTKDSPKVYKNTATFEGETENGNEIETNRAAEHTVKDEVVNQGKKEGKKVHPNPNDEEIIEDGWTSGSERQIAWDIYINYDKQDLGTGVTVTDVLGYDGVILEDSVEVYGYDVDPESGKAIPNTVLYSGEYELHVDGKKLILTFIDPVSERYVIRYRTTVPDESLQEYTNNATVQTGEGDVSYSGKVDWNEFDSFLDKKAVGGVNNNNQVYTGDEVNWEIGVNESLSVIENAVITDSISLGHIYKSGSMEIYRYQDQSTPLKEEKDGEDGDYTIEVVETDSGENVIITMSDTLTDRLVLKYVTVVTATDKEIENKVSLEGSNIEFQSTGPNLLSARQFSSVSGQWATNRGVISIEKVDSVTGETIDSGNETTFTLWYELNGEWVEYTQDKLFTTVGGKLEIGDLPIRPYKLKEENAPEGYKLSEEEITIDDLVAYGGNKDNIKLITFENEKEKIEISAEKVWQKDQQGDAPQRSIELQLTRTNKSDEEAEVVDTILLDGEEDSWSHTWSGLDRTNSAGEPYNYQIVELTHLPNYKDPIVEKATDEDGDITFTVTNEYAMPKTEVSVTKEWKDEDNFEGFRPASIEVSLYRESDTVSREFVETKQLNVDNEWTQKWENLDQRDSQGNDFTYEIVESEVPEYTSEIKRDGNVFTIVNTHEVTWISVSGEKIWNDGDDQDGLREGSIEVQLYESIGENGEAVEVENASKTVEEDENGKWLFEFTNLPKFKNGQEIDYSVQEINVPDGYEAAVTGSIAEGFIIENTHKSEERKISVQKIWDDENNIEGLRPTAVEVGLYREGVEEPLQTIVLSGDDWQGEFDSVPMYENQGQLIEYTVKEVNVSEWYHASEASITEADDSNEVEITNQRDVEYTSVTVNKTWNDANNRDGQRPDEITVRLLANGEFEEEKVITEDADKNWTYTFDHLQKYRNGVEIEYKIQELQVENYETEINGSEITNSYEPGKVSVNVIKNWDDAGDQDGLREDVTVQLYADNEPVEGKTIELTEKNGWQASFTDLDEYKTSTVGQRIVYTVQEVNVPKGYQLVEITGDAETGFVITNKHIPEVTKISGHKIWDDANNQDNKRPTDITLILYEDGEVEKTITVEADENGQWDYTFENLDKYRDHGKEIVYEVVEVAAKDYEEPIYDGEDIINTHVLETTEVEVTKTWNDADNQDGIREDKVTVQLMANGKATGQTAVLSEDNNWNYTFKDLLKYQEGEVGQLVVYTVEEMDVPTGYEAMVTGSIEEGFIIENTHKSETLDISVEKQWDDVNNQAKIRPNSITVVLLANGKVLKEQVITDEMDWKYQFTDLDKFSEGKAIVYEIREVEVEGYQTKIEGSVDKGFVITNKIDDDRLESPKTDKSGDGKGSKIIPQLGEEQIGALAVLGLLIIATTTAIFIERRKKQVR